MHRYECLQALTGDISDELVVTNLGATGLEWHAIKDRPGNLYSAGMGLVTPVSLGIALALPNRRVVALDGDGGLLLYPSILATLGNNNPSNLLVVVFDNEAYASTGPWQTATAGGTDLASMARAAGVKNTTTVRTLDEFRAAVQPALRGEGPAFVVAKIEPTKQPVPLHLSDGRETKYRFVRHVEETEQKTILRVSALKYDKASPYGLAASQPPEATGGDTVGDLVAAGLRDAGVDFMAWLPTTEFRPILERCLAQKTIRALQVSNEGDGAAICGGAWLGGKVPAMVVENSAAVVASYALTRLHRAFGIPLLLVTPYRGDLGEREWWAIDFGSVLEPLLAALGVPATVVRDPADIRPTIVGAVRAMQSSLRPYAVILGGRLTQP